MHTDYEYQQFSCKTIIKTIMKVSLNKEGKSGVYADLCTVRLILLEGQRWIKNMLLYQYVSKYDWKCSIWKDIMYIYSQKERQGYYISLDVTLLQKDIV